MNSGRSYVDKVSIFYRLKERKYSLIFTMKYYIKLKFPIKEGVGLALRTGYYLTATHKRPLCRHILFT